MKNVRWMRIIGIVLTALAVSACGEMADGTLDHSGAEGDDGAVEISTAEQSLAYCHANGNLRIISRSGWGAAPARGLRSRHNPYRITIHHTVTANTSAYASRQVRQVQQGHFARGFADIGYHFLVDREGRIYRGTAENRIGAHAGAANYGNLGIALLGSYHLSVEPTRAQRKAVSALVRMLAKRYGIAMNRTQIKGHREHKSTACPGHQTMKYINEMVRWAREATHTCEATPRYAMEFDVSLAAHRNDTLKDGRSREINDVYEHQNPRGVILMKNNSNRRLNHVRVKLQFSDDYLRAKRYAVFKMNSGWKKWKQMNWVYGRHDNPAEGALKTPDSLYVGHLGPGERRKIVVYFRAKRYSVGKSGHANIHAWVQSIDGVYGPANTWKADPKRNKFAYRKRGRGRVDILARDEWQFDGHHRRDVEGWRNSCNRAHARSLTIKKQTQTRSALQVSITGRDQCIASPTWTHIDAERFDEMVMRIHSSQGPHRLAVWWKTHPTQRWSRARRVVVRPGGAGYETLVIPVGDHPAWQGTVHQIRVDMLEGEAPQNGIERHLINKIFFQSSTTQKTSSTEESFVTKAPSTIVSM